MKRSFYVRVFQPTSTPTHSVRVKTIEWTRQLLFCCAVKQEAGTSRCSARNRIGQCCRMVQIRVMSEHHAPRLPPVAAAPVSNVGAESADPNRRAQDTSSASRGVSVTSNSSPLTHSQSQGNQRRLSRLHSPVYVGPGSMVHEVARGHNSYWQKADGQHLSPLMPANV